MDLVKYPRRRYIQGYTPIEKLSKLTEILGGATIYIKRDDLLGLTGGGNKTRKLEFVIADALQKGCDTIITCGAPQSNHCRLTLSAAIKEGLKCRMVIEERVPGSFDENASGNYFLFRLMGVDKIKVVQKGSDEVAEMQKMADEAAAEGLNPYIIDGSNASALSALGYVACAQEITAQTFDMGVHIDYIISASGSGGTHGGLVTGLCALNSTIETIGINVRREKDAQEKKVNKVVTDTISFLGLSMDPPENLVVCNDDYFPPGYSRPNPEMVEAVKLLASLEGILLDPVYTGKSMAGLIGLVRKGNIKKDKNVLFIHTGGSPALYAYQDYFFDNQENPIKKL
jgi:D-cysteine desulfhydrase